MTYHRKHDRTESRSWFSLFLRLGGWASLIAAVGLLILTAFSAGNLYSAGALDKDGEVALATVADKRFEVTTDSDGDDETVYYVTFKFAAQARGEVTVESEVDWAYYDGVAVQDLREVRYLRSDPTLLEYEPGQFRRTGTLLRYIALGLGIVGLTLLWVFGKQANRAIRVRRDGEKRLATVTDIMDTRVEVNGNPQGRLVWREADTQTGQSLMRDMYGLETLYRIGDEIVVFRLGKHAFWEGDVGPPKRKTGP